MPTNKFCQRKARLLNQRLLISMCSIGLFFLSAVHGMSARLHGTDTYHSFNFIHGFQVKSDTLIKPGNKSGLSSSQFIHFAAGLPGFARLVNQHGSVKVAFLGGSITHMEGWRGMVMDYLTKNYPLSEFQFLNAGIPSLGSVPHAFRLQKDVLHQVTPDLLFIESAVNDAVNGTKAIEQRRALEGIIRQAHQANLKMDMVLMAFADEEKNADYARGGVPASVQIHQQLAAYYHLPFINLAKEVFTRIGQGEFSWEKDFKNLHPAPFGQRLYFHAIKTLLDSAIHHPIQPKDRNHNTSIYFPKPMQSFSYAAGHYVDPDKAIDLNGFKVVNDWTPKDQANTRHGFVHVPVLCATKAGSHLSLKFRGTAVGIAVVSGPDAGKISYQVDAGPVRTMDLYTQWSNQLHLPWYEILRDGLSQKEHVLKIKIIPRKRSETPTSRSAVNDHEKTSIKPAENAVRIVYFLVNGPAAS